MRKATKTIAAGCLIFAAVGIVFGAVVQFDFLRYDEEQYVTKNLRVQAGITIDGIKWAFTTTEAGFWQPLVWLSHMLDCEIYGLNPAGHHLTSLLLHALNSVLLFLIVKSMTGSLSRSAFLACLFAVHPLHVESVAWIADRKDLLCALFWFLTMGAYGIYVRRPDRGHYLMVLATFALGLMSKPMIVTLPLIMLGLDFWPLRRVKDGNEDPVAGGRDQGGSGGGMSGKSTWPALLAEKLPFLALTLPVIFLTFLAERQAGALPAHEHFPLFMRLANVPINYVQYLIKAFYPFPLSVFYPLPGWRPLWQPILAGIALVLITVMVMRMSGKRPWLLTGWLWYLVALVPVSGLVQIGSHVMADRYTYIPLIGIFLIVSWGAGEVMERYGRRRLGAVLGGVLLMVLSFLSYRHVQTWRNTETVFRQALSATERNYPAHNNLGTLLLEKGRVEESVVHFREALRINPRFLTARVNLGNAMITMGRMAEGMDHYRAVLKEDPRNVNALRNLADALMKRGDSSAALPLYRILYQLEPVNPEVNNNLGVALFLSGRHEEGAVYIRRAVTLNPHYREARENLQRMMQK